MNSDTVHTALKRRNQILGEIKKLNTMTCQEGSASGRLKKAMLADLKKDLEAAQQVLYARKDKEVAKLNQELHDRTAKIQSLAAVKQQLEKDASEIQKRLEEAEMERDHAFNQPGERKPKVPTSGYWMFSRARQQSSQSSTLGRPRLRTLFWGIQRKSKPGSGNSFANI